MKLNLFHFSLLVNFSSKLPIKLLIPRKIAAATDKRYTNYASAIKKVSKIHLRTGHLNLKIVNQTISKETESLWENGCRQKCWDESLSGNFLKLVMNSSKFLV